MRKNITRIITAFLALLLTYNIPITTLAVDSLNDNMIVQVESVEAESGDTVQVNITLQNNPGVSSIKLNVEYDDYLTLTNIEFNSAFGSYVTTPEPYRNPQPLSILSPMSDISVNGTFATLTFKVSESAPGNYSASISITYDEDDIFNSDFDNVDVDIINGSVIICANDTPSFSIQAEQVSGFSGESINVNIMLKNNPGIASLKLNVRYGEYLTLTDVKFNDRFGSYVTTPEPYRNPQPLSMLSPMNDISVSGVFATLTFVIAENAPLGYVSNIQLSYDEDDLFNSDFDNVEAAVINGKITVENSFSISAKTGTTTVIDKSSKIIFGIDEMLSNVNDYITCSSCTISVNETEMGLGTCSTVNVIVNGTVKETYHIVIFGDVNGDGKYNGEDSVIVNCLAEGILKESDVCTEIYLAADCNHDGTVDNLDVVLLQESGLFINKISQINSD